MRLGAHVSVSGGFLNAIERAREIGANTIQIFGASPQQWKAPLPDEKEATLFSKALEKYDINPVFLHAPYLINLASPSDQLVAMSRTLLSKHLEISNMLGGEGVIFHMGSSMLSSNKNFDKKIISALSQIFEEVPNGKLIIENSTGAGNLIGDTLEEVAHIIKGVGNERLGFCYDTAHGFAAGVLTDFLKKGIDNFVKKIDKNVGIEKFWAIHANDSEAPANSNKDRHTNIGQGYIGEEGFKGLLANKFLKKIPFILEVPGFEGYGPDKRNLDILKKLATNN